MTFKALLAALGFNLLAASFAFSLWAEWGPYSWVASAQLALIGSYFGKATFILTFILHLIPAMILLIMARGRAALVLALGLPGLFLLAHLAATIYFVSTGGTQADASSFDAAVRSAAFVPHNISLQRSQLPGLDLDKTSGIRSGASDLGADLYIPFITTVSQPSETSVVLLSKSDNLKKLAQGEPLTGVIQKAPLPYLVRKTWPQNPSLFAVIIEDRASVRGNWIGAAVVYVVLLIWGASHFFKRRRLLRTPQP
ncbi:hypothetical protein [Prosthecobacter vanneervenii]|uniref:Uncharacterized protein n=1 Tax=Prosthecobacter vanneervenii TaxID=48466 RepID=A0A7W7YAQ1_9BACT|nr:hypothetical protein [Prosthecobacter vanneervenii]MBB5032743.1 hypothetical protein [Prosthecobacter vanneervenii]